MKNLIDACERWWGFVKDVRNILLHREHERLVFGYPHDGILFQVYEGSISPKIIDGSLLWTQGHNVVDFELYSGFVVGELILFLDELSSGIAEKLEIRDEATPEAIRSGDFSTLIVSMERLSMVEGSGK